MAPSWWKHPDNKLKGCQEFLTDACDIVPHDGCCSATPCKLCLEWETYTGIEYGSAEFGTSSWTGTVGGGSFVAYWERNYETDECEFIVTFDGDEVYRATCYEGASCRNPAGEVAASIGYEEGTLRWSVYEPRELQLIDDPETGCRDFFCGACRCTCDCLCVTISEPDGNIIQGELCTSSYPCDAPVWEGTLGYYDLSIALGRDAYTAECIISLTANGEEPEPVFVTGCADMSASVTLYDGTVISVVCKQCGCDDSRDFPCCPGQPFPDILTLTFLSQNPECACLDGQTTILFAVDPLAAQTTWVGVYRYPCDVNADPTQVDYFKFTTSCGPSGQFAVVLIEHIDQAAASPEPAVDDVRWVSKGTYNLTTGQCDPFYWRYEAANDDPIQDAWRECEDDFMDTPHIWMELTL